MTIEWDDAKSRANLVKHDVSFAWAARIFDGPLLEWEDTRWDYGEQRFIAIGHVGSRILSVVDTWRGGRRRITSARKANRSERDAYRAQNS